jgi:hypothetical protein
VDVTAADLWLKVGKLLKQHRDDRKWRPIDVERAHGPSYKTVQAIEDGTVGTVESLEKFAHALDLSIVDVLQSILASTVTPLSPEAAQVVRKFSQTTVDGRQAMLSLVRALPDAPTAPTLMLPLPDAEESPVRPRPPRPVRQAAARRKSR